VASKFATREDILKASDIETKDIEVREWGGVVRIKALTSLERDAFTTSITVGKGRDKDVNLKNFRAKFVSLCLVDENGQRLFNKPEDLGKKSSAVIERLFREASEMSGLTDEQFQEAIKNSSSDQSDDLLSA
jgi:hypothetical protein